MRRRRFFQKNIHNFCVFPQNVTQKFPNNKIRRLILDVKVFILGRMRVPKIKPRLVLSTRVYVCGPRREPPARAGESEGGSPQSPEMVGQKMDLLKILNKN